ncbi:serine protease [Ruegeria sp. HKCCD8929]|uniref:trypsin-like serine peptidase n=1 Tax=Ruegeria sp. HKCCD8929 TaxID=2683006 RepID=UPI00148857C0|nr:serine protease [Ruegeria sp. HKCCD8929]
MEDLTTVPLDVLRSVLQSRGRLGPESTFSLQSIEHAGDGYVYPNLVPGGGSKKSNVFEGISSGRIFEEIQARQKALYGEDDRQEIYQLQDARAKENARSVAALVHVNHVFPSGSDAAEVSSKTMAEKFQEAGTPLCEREPFQNQPAPALGTAFLISRTLLATAGHNLDRSNYHTRRVIFDFVLSSGGSTRTMFDSSEIYGIKNYIDGQVTSNGADWAIVELDRPVLDRDPLKFRMSGRVENGAGLYVVGCPSGLPKKFAGNAQVRENTKNDYFVANLDTYGGNSGSPVFNAGSHEVEGILVRGQTDFAPLGDCVASLVCPLTGCRGEDCNRMEPIAEHFSKMS